ncbi:MAG: hypothetical protein UY18_C0022G0006 [Microgenomates group bacterium GW2011_GWF2_47_9]|nr:MAG: hypothetical protein UY18_C0022G0006 [Microgenomates group bacterium GW2011_GWF2_47_9]
MVVSIPHFDMQIYSLIARQGRGVPLVLGNQKKSKNPKTQKKIRPPALGTRRIR